LSTSNGNIIANNTVTSNQWRGIEVSGDENEIINNTVTGTNIWDNGYPSGGNYWSDYPGSDHYIGVGQDEPGSDGIGDIPYIIDGNSSDNFPFIWIYIPPISISNVTVSPATASIGTQITVCADVSAISGVKNGGVIDGSVVEQIRLLDHNKDGSYCRNHYFTEYGVYHVDVIAADREGRALELKDDAATFVIDPGPYKTWKTHP
jgi:parallel beta-helix repeat protein